MLTETLRRPARRKKNSMPSSTTSAVLEVLPRTPASTFRASGRASKPSARKRKNLKPISAITQVTGKKERRR
jgi:hypothetical protein